MEIKDFITLRVCYERRSLPAREIFTLYMFQCEKPEMPPPMRKFTTILQEKNQMDWGHGSGGKAHA
jgi:hypothetical protein